VRVIAATNRDLESDVRAGRFREDLYYRLSTFRLRVPTLAERSEDIPLLAASLLSQAMAKLGKKVDGFTDEALACMMAYHWPGNVRELQNEVQRMLVMCDDDRIGAELLSPHILRAAPEESEEELNWLSATDGTLKERMDSLEACLVREAMIRNRWNKSRAAKELGLSRVGLSNKLERYDLEKVQTLEDARQQDDTAASRL